MSDKAYKGLMARLMEERELATFCSMAGASHEDRVGKCGAFFLQAVGLRDDETAVRYCGWIFQAIDDWFLLPLALSGDGAHVYTLPSSEDVTVARQGARAIRANHAMALYKKVPAIQIQKDHRGCDHGIEIMIKTREALLTEIVGAWRDSTSEAEADRSFAFLNEEVLGTSISNERREEAKMIQRVFRAATDEHFPASRLGRHIVALRLAEASRFSNAFGHHEELARLFRVAWARNSDLERLQLVVQATDALPGKGTEAFRLLREHAEKIALFERDVCELTVHMQPPGFGPEVDQVRRAIVAAGFDLVHGTFAVAYQPDLRSLDLIITQKAQSSYEVNENACHEQFEHAKKHIAWWRKVHPRYCVNLKLVVPKQSYADDATPEFLFVREQQL